jgi:type IV pilus assembly protein PilY1
MITLSRSMFSKVAQAVFLVLAINVSAHSSPLSLQNVPLYLSSTVDPNVLINMSVETPMGGAAYNDNVGIPAGCAGRRNNVLGDANADDVGSCYFAATDYLGYFDPKKCYDYSSNRFNPVGAAAADHSCTTSSGRWSGNFLNWTSMTAIDMFIWNMTGGNRIEDTTSRTVIRRARKQDNDSWFPRKVISSTINVAPSTVTPYGDGSPVFIHNTAWGFNIGSTFAGAINGSGAGFVASFQADVRVCRVSAGLEDNCVSYGSYSKPEGLIQKNATSKRFGVISYTLDNSATRNGGVLRSNMKYIGPTLPDGSNNTGKEYGSDGILISNPDGASGGLNSGVINYINEFSESGYKSHDPIGELFYEGIRYFKHLSPTPEYSSGLAGDLSQHGGFQIVNTWNDPIQYRCQKNFTVAINDANPWLDKKLPGTFFTAATMAGASGTVNLSDSDFGEPSNPDTSINVRQLTNTVGGLEGLNGATWSNSGTWTSGSVSGTNDSVGGGVGTFDNSCTNKAVANLGEVMGTCPYPAKQNSYYIAGLAYYANTTDLRADLANDRGIQNVQSFIIDTQEFNSNPLDGPKNMLWLAGKYGGFTDQPNAATGDKIPQTNEWDADGDGSPDNYVLATQPENLIEGLNRAFAFIDSRISSASPASVNSGSIRSDTRVFQSRFNSGEWTGELLAYVINPTTGVLTRDPLWVDPQISTPDLRKIVTVNSNRAAVPFQWSSLDATRRGQLDNDQLKLDYLRGDDVNEGSASGQFRPRPTSKLGDIISSAPLFVGRPAFRYRDSLESVAYSTFATAQNSRIGMVYAGANDGMLHGFNATNGNEVFAFVPSAVFPRLKNLASQAYTHQYYVDGAPSMGDVFYGTTGAWHTVLVGGLNKGGQEIYALDVTNPTTLAAAETNATNVALWEFLDRDDPGKTGIQGDSDLGSTYSQPSIVKLRNGKWAAVFGNGYNNKDSDGSASTTGNAVLYIVDIETGTLIRKLDTGAGTAQDPTGAGRDNGLATPALVDTNADRIVEYAYAGDLFGNMWKFNLSSTTSADWDVAYRNSSNVPLPLFQARDSSSNAQPITVRPEVARGPFGAGMIVLFGTGKYLETVDKQLPPAQPRRDQSFYGIVDRNSGSLSDRITARTSLTQQTILAEASVDPDGAGPLSALNLRATSNNPLGANSGWYIDLVSSALGYQAEKQVSNPIVRNGNIVFTTLIPDTDPCNFGGGGWIMELNMLDGSRLEVTPFDLNNDGQFTNGDNLVTITLSDGSTVQVPASGIGSTEGILNAPGVIEGEIGPLGEGRPVQFKYLPGSSGGIQRITENPGVGGTGRQSWRQVR